MFLQGLLSYRILPKELLEKAWTPHILVNGVKTNYGYGWTLNNLNQLRSIEHGGHMNGFTSSLIYYPDEQITIALLFNDQDAPRDKLSRLLSELVLGRSLEMESKSVDPQVMESYTGIYALTGNKSRTITVSKTKGGLVAKVSGQDGFEILFTDASHFRLKNISDATGEFKLKDGNVASMIINQNGVFEWIKIK
ncbi:beta-lactamase family protein [Niabella hibiscisoli]|uniref:beta-lactamase family protein n=1 Tax=Niabella hibiscisoli TaxID=1825928 RepID=UPI0021D48679|nr:beta-lactamase family protein [Niabella hibiscisoli]